ncbi:TPA: hypothetical protein HA351_06610 [Methanosarcinaceae archaeon]|nr:hypothetical protein [Methanosarcinaceae archaeon]
MVILLLTAALFTSGCLSDGGTKFSISDNDTEIEVDLPGTPEDEWCPVGSHIKVTNPITKKALDMTVIGKEEFEGETLCKAALETTGEEGTSTFEYMWSEDKNTTVFTRYDTEGNISLKYISKDGKKTIIGGDGKTLEF